MADELLIGIDVGTQGTKAALYRPDGTQIGQEYVASRLIYGKNGSVEQNAEEIFHSVTSSIRGVMQRTKAEACAVKALAIDGQMAGIMGIDRDWNAVTPYDSWLDTRCDPYVREMKEKAEEEIIRKTGGQVTYTHGPKILWWKNKRPEVYEKIDKFIQPSVYAAGRLCGLKAKDAFVDYTYLHFSGFADNPALRWDEKLLRMFDVNPEKMPDICSPDKVVGELTDEAAEMCGLCNGTPVAAGCGDTAASSLGCGITRKGLLFDVAGTASIFSAATDEFAPDIKEKTLLYARSAVEGLWIPLAYLSGGGLCMRWFRDMTEKTYEELEELAEQIPWGSDGLHFIPHFTGVTCPNMPGVKGGYWGLKWNHTAGHLYRSILESIVWEYGNYYRILKENVRTLNASVIYGAGGGVNSELFCRMKADVLKTPYFALENADAAVWGSAVIAGIAVGRIKSVREVSKSLKIKKRYEPDMEKGGNLEGFVLEYSRLLKKLMK